MLLALNFD